MFKTKLLSVLLTLLFTSAFLPITLSAMPVVNIVKSIPSIEVNVNKCNYFYRSSGVFCLYLTFRKNRFNALSTFIYKKRLQILVK